MDPHVQLMSQIEAQYMAKNLMYANAAHVTCCRFGLVSYALRLTDKMSRYENLRLHSDIDKGDEAIDDTLRDAINYVCMCIGDLRADESDVGSTENVKETLKAIRSMANANEARVLKKKLMDKGLTFEENTSIDDMERLGFTELPVLCIDGNAYEFPSAVQWVNAQ